MPRLPSARIVDVAAALIGDREIEVEFIGVRPGEKIHEMLVSEEEAPRTVVARATTWRSRRCCPSCAPSVRRRSTPSSLATAREYSVGRAASAPRLAASADASTSWLDGAPDEGRDRPRHPARDHPPVPA